MTYYIPIIPSENGFGSEYVLVTILCNQTALIHFYTHHSNPHVLKWVNCRGKVTR